MSSGISSSLGHNASDVFTDVQSLQKLKVEKNTDAALKQVSQQFESMFTSMMLKSMREANAVFEDDSLVTSDETKFYRDMYDQQLALHLSHNKGLGIADVLYRQFTNRKGVTHSQSDKTQDPEDLQSIKTEKMAALPARDSSVPPLLKPKISSPVAAALMPAKTVVESFQDPYSDDAPTELPPKTDAATTKPLAKVESLLRLSVRSPSEFVEQLLPYARSAAAQLGVNPLMLMAQAALETGWGQRMLKDQQGNTSNNFFNIKSSSGWGGNHVDVSTLEYRNGIAQQEQAKFRKYSSVAASFQDYVDFIKGNPRYQQALDTAGDAKHYIQALHGAGYATDPAYSQKIIGLFEALKAGKYSGD